MNKDEMHTTLLKSVATVTFTKADGSERLLKCTLQESFLPVREIDQSGVQLETVADTQSRKATNENVLCVWDLENSGWRSFRVDSVKSFELTA